jgi:putative ABC transport system permease protein
MFRYLPLILKNTLRNRRRSLLTISSIAASMCLLGVLFALYRALFLSPPAPGQELRLVTYHRVSLTQSLPAAYQDKIRRVPGVRETSVWQWFGGAYKDARDQRNFFARFAVEPERFLRMRTEYLIPEDQKKAFLTQRTACIVSRTLADKFGWKIGERIPLIGDIFPVNPELTLVGIFDDPERSESLFFNHEYLREGLTGARKDQIGAVTIQAENAESVPRISATIDKMFENSTAQTRTESEQAFALSFVSFIGNVKVFLLAICGAVTFTILLVSGNTMAMTVRERIREVGILKTLGFPNGAILGMILGEAAFISLLGGVLGVALASVIAFVIRQGPGFIQAMKTLTISPSVALFCLAFAMVIGVASSLIPAAGAARTAILDALRNSG